MGTARRIEVSSALGPQVGLRPRAIVHGVLFTFVLSLLLSGVMAAVVYFSSFTEAGASNLLYFGGLFALAAGAGYGARRAETLGWLHGAAIGVVYVLLSVLAGLALFPAGAMPHDLLRRLAMGCGVGILGGVLGVNL